MPIPGYALPRKAKFPKNSETVVNLLAGVRGQKGLDSLGLAIATSLHQLHRVATHQRPTRERCTPILLPCIIQVPNGLLQELITPQL
jgi:hypothetical protein